MNKYKVVLNLGGFFTPSEVSVIVEASNEAQAGEMAITAAAWARILKADYQASVKSVTLVE